MRQMLGALILGTVLASGAVAAYASESTDLGLPPLQPMGSAAVITPAGEPDFQPAAPPSWVVQPDQINDRDNRE